MEAGTWCKRRSGELRWIQTVVLSVSPHHRKSAFKGGSIQEILGTNKEMFAEVQCVKFDQRKSVKVYDN